MQWSWHQSADARFAYIYSLGHFTADKRKYMIWYWKIFSMFFGSVRFLCWMPLSALSYECHFLSCPMINSLIQGCLWPLLFVLNYILTLGIWRSATSHFPGCFCPWTFFQNIKFNMAPSDPFMSHLATQLGYTAGELQALQLIILAAFRVVD